MNNHWTPSLLKAAWTKVVDVWYRLQLTHYGGKYSVERMLALEEYTRRTSLVRAVVVSAGMPIAILAVVLCQESVPLQDPAEGWRANYGFWVRVVVLGIVIGVLITKQVTCFLDLPAFSFGQTVFYGVGIMASFVLPGVGIAAKCFFPVPFFIVFVSMITTVMCVILLPVVVGLSAFQKMFVQDEQLRHRCKVFLIPGFIYTTYPAYEMLFRHAVHTRYELPVLLLRPVIRLITRNGFRSSLSHIEDTIPHQVIFLVDFFDALYLATFLQTMSSTSMIAIMFADLIETVIELHELDRQTKHILARTHEALGRNARDDIGDLLTTVRALCHSLKEFPGVDIQVRSCIAHHLSTESETLLTKIESARGSDIRDTGPSHQAMQTPVKFVRVQPQSLPPALLSPQLSSFRWFKRNSRRGTAIIPSKHTEMATHRESPDISSVLQEVLRVLFTSECIILTEYLEVFVPTLYGTFILAMVHLPSAKYHSEMENITLDNIDDTIQNIFLYALLEFLSIIVLAVISWRNCGIRVLYQLAFVLDTQLLTLVIMTLHWMTVTLTYRVVHFGMSIIAWAFFAFVASFT